MSTILIADDDESIVGLIEAVLAEAGYRVLVCRDGRSALEAFRKERPDLMLLDVVMPKMSGFEVCEAVREEDGATPVIFLSAKGDIVDKKVGYRLGADEYMTKPFNSDELLLHIAAVLRRCSLRQQPDTPAAWGPFACGAFSFDPAALTVRRNGITVTLSPREFRVLEHMARHAGEVFTREDLVRDIWGEEYLSSGVGIAVYIRHLRQKIEDDPSHPCHLQTVGRIGYRFVG